MMSPTYLFDLMMHMFRGFGLSLIYGVGTSAAIWIISSDQFQQYVRLYFISFNCLVSGGLIIGTALFVFSTQKNILCFIEKAFDEDALKATKYEEWKSNYLSAWRTLVFSTEFIVAGFVIFFVCRFPLRGTPEYLMIFFGCVQYALGVYVGRKLFNIANILHAITDIRFTRDIFKNDELNYIVVYVNALSTLTIVFVYIHVKSYFDGPFEYTTVLGQSPKITLLLPAVLATPVLIIFNFYPRAVLRKLYSRSIEEEVGRLTENLKNENLSEFERLSYLIEYDRLAKEELRNRLRISLSDLPIGITIIVMIVGFLSRYA